jgi:hypothetical protein
MIPQQDARKALIDQWLEKSVSCKASADHADPATPDHGFYRGKAAAFIACAQMLEALSASSGSAEKPQDSDGNYRLGLKDGQRGQVWCKVRRAGKTDPPQDCDWPFCGCDPHADKVIAHLQECGLLREKSASSETQEERSERSLIAAILADYPDELADDACDGCEYCGPRGTVMCSFHSVLSMLQGHTIPTAFLAEASPSQPAERPEQSVPTIAELVGYVDFGATPAETPEERKVGESMGLSGYLMVPPKEGQ